MKEKTPNNKTLKEKILDILNKIQSKRSQINFDSQSARADLAETIASDLN